MSNDILVRIAKLNHQVELTENELNILKHDLECVQYQPSYNVLYNMYRNKKRKHEIDKATLKALQDEIGE